MDNIKLILDKALRMLLYLQSICHNSVIIDYIQNLIPVKVDVFFTQIKRFVLT